MKQTNPRGRGLTVALALLTLGGALAVPHAARADDGDKGKKVPIVIKDPIITDDPPAPTPPPKKK